MWSLCLKNHQKMLKNGRHEQGLKQLVVVTLLMSVLSLNIFISIDCPGLSLVNCHSFGTLYMPIQLIDFQEKEKQK